jgi:hypothetical protein
LAQLLTCPIIIPPPLNFEELSKSTEYEVEMHHALKGGAGELYLSSKSATTTTKKLYEMSNQIKDSSPFVGCFLKGLVSNRACLGYHMHAEMIQKYYSAVTNNPRFGFV